MRHRSARLSYSSISHWRNFWKQSQRYELKLKGIDRFWNLNLAGYRFGRLSNFKPALPPPLTDNPTRLLLIFRVQIEDLNGQISALHIETLRLSASEIALGVQLGKERERLSAS